MFIEISTWILYCIWHDDQNANDMCVLLCVRCDYKNIYTRKCKRMCFFSRLKNFRFRSTNFSMFFIFGHGRAFIICVYQFNYLFLLAISLAPCLREISEKRCVYCIHYWMNFYKVLFGPLNAIFCHTELLNECFIYVLRATTKMITPVSDYHSNLWGWIVGPHSLRYWEFSIIWAFDFIFENIYASNCWRLKQVIVNKSRDHPGN